MSHARLAPSSAAAWSRCPGSIPMQEQYPDKDSESSKAGEASHWVGSEILAAGRYHNPGETAPNGVVLDEEMVQGALGYAITVTNSNPAAQLYVEQPVAIRSVHPTDCFGTPDLFYWQPATWTLHVWDYKYGWIIVDVQGNMQLITYGIGLIEWLASFLTWPDGRPMSYTEVDQHVTIVFHIYQPRPYHALGPHREWSVRASDLRAHLNVLKAAAENALSLEARCVTGTHCQYCSARHACPAARSAFYAALEYIEQARTQALSPEELATELLFSERAEQAIKYLRTGLLAQATGIIEAGGHLPGWALERGPGRSDWTVPASEVFALGDLVGKNLRAPEKPITPSQAKAAGLSADLVKQYSTTPLGDPKLVRSNKTKAAVLFGMAHKGA